MKPLVGIMGLLVIMALTLYLTILGALGLWHDSAWALALPVGLWLSFKLYQSFRLA